MAIQKKYRGTGEGPVVTLGYSDIATGKKRVDLYAGLVHEDYASGALTTDAVGILSNIPFYSDVIFTSVSVNNTAYRKDFDLDFTLPQAIEGTAIVQIPVVAQSGCGGTSNYWYDVEFFHVDSSDVATSISSGATRSLLVPSGVASHALLSWSGDISLTKFRKNEKLRLRLWGRHGGAVGGYYYLGVDPKNRTWGDGTTTLPSNILAQVPFRIDL